jgi:hypothetical protein
MNIMLGVEKEWKFYTNFYFSGNISAQYIPLKVKKIEYATPGPLPEKINVTSFNFGGSIGYYF